MKKMKIQWLAAGIILTAVIIGAFFAGIYGNDGKLRFVVQDSSEAFELTKSLPDSPVTAPVYRVTATDSVFEGTPKTLEIKQSIPSVAEAPVLAQKILDNYGGLPKDAILYKVERVAIKKYNTKTGVVEEEYPQFTQVIYTQQINGMPVIGPGAEINIALGEKGELLSIEKAWRHLEYAGDVSVISSGEAYDKLKKGETLFVYQSSPVGKKVTDVKMGYYAEHREKDQKVYTPVWLFYAAKDGKTPVPYPVDAVKKT